MRKKYPAWMNALAWTALVLPVAGTAMVVLGFTQTGLIAAAVGFATLWGFSEWAVQDRVKRGG